ncbi:MAG: HEAT repeat protein/Mg-chelatase subunit ChlD [Chlamydiales bacterium]|jgi:HEAT repeat protein/Mg-chelatase subunit ChlD
MLRRTMIRLLLFLFTLAWVTVASSTFTSASSRGGQDEVAQLIEAIGHARDSAQPADVQRLAERRTREAALGLVELYDRMGTTYTRLAIVRGLGLFDGVGDAEQPAFQKLMEVATTARASELRRAAIEGLGRSQGLGRQFLERIVDSPAEDGVRVHALRMHVTHATEDDHEWYLQLFEGGGGKEEKRGVRSRWGAKRDTEERELEVHSVPELRAVAFGVVAAQMSVRKLLEASEDDAASIRYAALEQLRARDPKVAARRAAEMFDRTDEKGANRVLAAEVLAEVKGKRIANEFIDVGCKFATPEELRAALAQLLAGFDEPAVDKKIVKLIGRPKAKAHVTVFALSAARSAEDPKLTRKILKELEAGTPEVRIAAIEALGWRGDPEAIRALEGLIVGPIDVETTVAVLDALSLLRAGDPEWRETLIGYASSDTSAVRNAALISLGGDAGILSLLVDALGHEHWTTRRIALEGLIAIGTKEVVPILIARLEQEDGRLLQEIVDGLFRLTGMPFPPNPLRWNAWWAREGAGFEVLGPEELERRRADAEERDMRRTTSVEFLGVRIVSHRVIFVIDTSGSMNEALRTRFVGETTGEARIEVARRELKLAIDALDAATMFNVVTFGSGVSRWLEGSIALSDQSHREAAGEWIERLAAFGGTNLHGGLQAAFADPDVDTIFLLSDGEPSVGEVTDPYAIRTLVKRWNQHRGVIIHALAVGTSLDVLAWLAEDSGGTYVEFR